jgi:hypothetical protein
MTTISATSEVMMTVLTVPRITDPHLPVFMMMLLWEVP